MQHDSEPKASVIGASFHTPPDGREDQSSTSTDSYEFIRFPVGNTELEQVRNSSRVAHVVLVVLFFVWLGVETTALSRTSTAGFAFAWIALVVLHALCLILHWKAPENAGYVQAGTGPRVDGLFVEEGRGLAENHTGRLLGEGPGEGASNPFSSVFEAGRDPEIPSSPFTAVAAGAEEAEKGDEDVHLHREGPGREPRGENVHGFPQRETGGRLVRGETEEGEQEGVCLHCRIKQPTRTKHCKRCRVCVVTFDHHCFWIGGCVGEFNHWKFLLLLSAETVALSVDWTLAFTAFHARFHAVDWFSRNALTFVIVGLLSGLLVATICLLGFHLFLAMTNQTTWERMRRKRIGYLRDLPPFLQPFSEGEGLSALAANFRDLFRRRGPPARSWSISWREGQRVPFNYFDNEWYECGCGA